MPKEKPNAGGVDALTATLAGLLLLVALAALQVYWTAGAVIDAAQDKETYFVIITKDGIQSENAGLEDKVNSGLAALKWARQLGLALLVGCGLVFAGLLWRSLVGVKNVCKEGLPKER